MIKPISNNDNKTLKNVIRNNLQVFHNFCEKHNLTYYLSDGTLLGAIRHKGMIPWDDDADVCMPRKDYNKLLSLAQKIDLPYKLEHFKLNKDYIYPIFKFTDTRINIKAYYGDSYYQTGVWIDIFPLDGTYENLKLRKLHYNITKGLRFLFQLRTRNYSVPTDKTNKFKHFVKKNIKPIIFFIIKIIPKSFFFTLMDKCASHKNFDKTKIVGNLYTFISIKASHQKEWFAARELSEFDGYKFYIPFGYDGYLTNLYGDYMTPPTESERKKHNIEIVAIDGVILSE